MDWRLRNIGLHLTKSKISQVVPIPRDQRDGCSLIEIILRDRQHAAVFGGHARSEHLTARSDGRHAYPYTIRGLMRI